MTQTIINYLNMPDAVNITLADDATFAGLRAAWLLVVICGLIIMFKVFKLILEIAERYIILAILTLCAPLAFGMGGSRNTSDIFTGWCRMFGSMCLVMVTNAIFFKMLLSVLSFVPSGLDVVPWMILVFGIVKVAKKIDAIITRIGLNPAITGDGLGGRSLPGMLTYAVVRAVGQQVAKSAGKNAGGRSHGGSTAPPGGGGRTDPGQARFPVGRALPARQERQAVLQVQTPPAASNPAPRQEVPHPSRRAIPQSGPPRGYGAVWRPVHGRQAAGRGTPQGAGVSGSVNGVDSRTQSTAAYQSNSTRKTSVTPGTHRAHPMFRPPDGPAWQEQPRPSPEALGRGAAGQGAFEGQNGMAGTSRIVGVAGMRSGTTGTGNQEQVPP